MAVGNCSVTERRRWRPPYITGKTVQYMCTQKHCKYEDGRTATGVHGHGFVPLNHSGNVVTRTGLQQLKLWTPQRLLFDLEVTGHGQRWSQEAQLMDSTPVTQRQPTRLTTTNAFENNRQVLGVNTCLGTTCHGSNWSMARVWSVASCSQIGIYSLWLLIDFSSVCCSLSRWLSLGNRCGFVPSGLRGNIVNRTGRKQLRELFFELDRTVPLSLPRNIATRNGRHEWDLTHVRTDKTQISIRIRAI